MAQGRGKQIGAGLSGEERGKGVWHEGGGSRLEQDCGEEGEEGVRGCGTREGEADWSRAVGRGEG